MITFLAEKALARIGMLSMQASFWLAHKVWTKHRGKVLKKYAPWWIVMDIIYDKNGMEDKIVLGPYSKEECFEELDSDSSHVYALSTIDAKAWRYTVDDVYATQEKPPGEHTAIYAR